MKAFLAAFRFLTVLPFPGRWGTAQEDLARSLPFFPVVGLGIGALLAAMGIAIENLNLFEPILGAAILVATLVAITAALHLDGLSDTADGFLSHRSPERILEIMKDSHVGPMGVIVLILVLLLKVVALASIDRLNTYRALLLAPLAGRCAMVLVIAALPYARPDGLGAVFFAKQRRWPAVWALAVLAGVSYAVGGEGGLIGAAAALVVTIAFALQCMRKIGGATGDTLGATCELAETAVLIALAATPMQDLLKTSPYW